MLNKKYYKVNLSSVDLGKTIDSIDDIKDGSMLNIINTASLKDAGEVMVYRSLSGKFREMITRKEISAVTEELAPYSTSHNYRITRRVPVFFKCNVSLEDDTTREYELLESMEASPSEIEEYLVKHLGTDKSQIEYLKYEYLAELNTIESRAKEEYKQLLGYYGFAKKPYSKEDKENIKTMRKKYNV